jgi:hypothetical protein
LGSFDLGFFFQSFLAQKKSKTSDKNMIKNKTTMLDIAMTDEVLMTVAITFFWAFSISQLMPE